MTLGKVGMNQAWGFQAGGLPGHLSGFHQGLPPPPLTHHPISLPGLCGGKKGCRDGWEAESPLPKEQQQMVAGMKSE